MSVLVLVASIGSYAYLQARTEAREHRSVVVDGARATLAVTAEAVARQILVGDYAGVDQSLIQISQLSGFLRLQACEPDGTTPR